MDLLIDDAGGVRRLTLNRPHVRNALSVSLQEQLVAALLSADADPAVSVVVVTGQGEQAFCSGVDVKELDRLGDTGWRGPYAQPHRSVWQALVELSKPTIASVNGHAVGGGFELLLACDLTIAVRGISVGLPEARLGLAASFASAQLPRRVPHGIAAELLFTGALRPVDDLVQWGLVQRVVPREELAATTLDLADTIARNAPLSLRRMKATMTKGMALPLMSAVTLGAGPDPYTSQDRLEGVRAFAERRPPHWSGQ
ncbi:enoyl-CoA hydratase/isomerase family protein [Nocardia jiangxiensis]|uniref:Enoyl-CoA hydratase/isomerase family protein n=1 Tax=Nocardia jiangxiensis TaxID=282685 RepID=A0ABW6SCE4_9NOCA|nr:enoyl-CoA hydratase-related protein [Nocardia jiangxiensis]